MSYKNNFSSIRPNYNNGDFYFNDESVINVNKTRFHEFYYEELDKLNKKYYDTKTNNLAANQTSNSQFPINDTANENTATLNLRLDSMDLVESNKNNTLNLMEVKTLTTQTQPINIRINPSHINQTSHIHRYRLNSLNNLLNSPPIANNDQIELNLSISPFGTNSTNTNMNDSQKSNSQHCPASRFNDEKEQISEILDFNMPFIDLHIPTPSHKMIVKRVYDNHLLLNIDNLLINFPINTYITNILYDFISDELNFLSELSHNLATDPFELINISTIGLLFDRMNKCKFSLRLAHIDIILILNELSNRINIEKRPKSIIKQSILDAAIGILQHTTNELLQPGLIIDQVFVKSLGQFITWIYSNYGQYYWMPSAITNISYNLATELSARFGINITSDIYKTIRLYFIPSYLFSVSRMVWKFTNIHRREIHKLRSIIIPPSSDTYWIIKCLDQYRNIHYVHPSTVNIKNIIIFIDGRNWFYSEEHIKTTGGINLELLRQFLTLSEYQQLMADLVFGRITQLMTNGRQLSKPDPAFIIPILIFNEKHRSLIQPLIQQHHTHNSNNTHNTQNIIFTPRGQNDDLMTLYLWLSNPGSFIASNDNFGDHAARIAQYPIQSKYFEGLWVELIRCFKLLNPFTNTTRNGSYIIRNIPNNQTGCSAPF